jgi:hypothetical protein
MSSNVALYIAHHNPRSTKKIKKVQRRKGGRAEHHWLGMEKNR